MAKQGTLGDDDQVWNELSSLDDARLAHYSRTGSYQSIAGTAVIERARRYLAKLPLAISGQGGRAAMWRAVMSLVHGFELSAEAAHEMLIPWNAECSPPFSAHELQATCWRAHRKAGVRGKLLRGERCARMTERWERARWSPRDCPASWTAASASRWRRRW